MAPSGGEYDSANERAPDTQSEDDTLDDSLTGSLDSLLLSPLDAWVPMELESSSIRVAVATNDFVTVTLMQKMNFQQLLEIVCQRKQLATNSHYLVVGDDEIEVKGHDLVSEIDRKLVRIKKKRQYHIEIHSQSRDFGIIFKKPKALCRPLEIEIVTPDGVAESSGILPDEEILVLNGELTLDMEDDDVRQVLETAGMPTTRSLFAKQSAIFEEMGLPRKCSGRLCQRRHLLNINQTAYSDVNGVF